MTTAHRATYKAAKATFNGIEQGNYFTGGVGTTAVAARDLPGQKSLKRRMIGQGTEEELGSKDFKKILEKKEAAHVSKRLKMLDDYDDSDDEVDEIKLLAPKGKATDGAEESTTGDSSKQSNANSIDNKDDNAEEDAPGDSSSDDDSDDEEALLLELEKIRNEKASKHANEVRQGNPLLNQDEGAAVQSGVAASNVIKSRWDDDVVFKHQASGAMKNKKKSFVNDTTRNDFHRKFMDKYIK